MPPSSSTSRKFSISSSLTVLSKGLPFSLKPKGELALSNIFYAVTCSRSPRRTRKQKRASVGHSPERKRQNSFSPGSLDRKWFSESTRFTSSCSSLSLSFAEQIMLLQNQSPKQRLRTWDDFFLFSFQNFQQEFSTSSQRASSCILFGQMQIQTKGWRSSSQASPPIFTVLDILFLLASLGFLDGASAFSWGPTLTCAMYWLSLCSNLMLEWAMSSTHILRWALVREDMLISIFFIVSCYNIQETCLIMMVLAGTLRVQPQTRGRRNGSRRN